MFQPAYSSDDFNQTSVNLLRSGTVIDRRMGDNGPEVRVAYPDRGVTSDWIPVGSQGGGGTTNFFCPRVGTNVTVGHLGTGVEQGIVLCSNPTDNGGAVQPDSLNSHATIYDDGAQIGYNPDTGEWSALGVMKINFGSGGSVVIYAGGDVFIQSGGNLTAQVGGDLTATVFGTATLNAPTVNINASNINLNGNTSVSGTLGVSGDVTFDAGGTIAQHLTNLDGAGGGS